MKFEGKLLHIGEVETVGKNAMAKVTIVIEETEGEYPNSLAVDLWGDKTEFIKSYSVGDEVTVDLNHKAREYKDRYFNSISVWKISKKEGLASDEEAQGEGELPF